MRPTRPPRKRVFDVRKRNAEIVVGAEAEAPAEIVGVAGVVTEPLSIVAEASVVAGAAHAPHHLVVEMFEIVTSIEVLRAGIHTSLETGGLHNVMRGDGGPTAGPLQPTLPPDHAPQLPVRLVVVDRAPGLTALLGGAAFYRARHPPTARLARDLALHCARTTIARVGGLPP